MVAKYWTGEKLSSLAEGQGTFRTHSHCATVKTKQCNFTLSLKHVLPVFEPPAVGSTTSREGSPMFIRELFEL